MVDILTNILTPANLLMMNIGVAVGVIVGAMPGLNTIFAITVLLPFTFGLDSTTGMYLLLGASAGGLFGGFYFRYPHQYSRYTGPLALRYLMAIPWLKKGMRVMHFVMH